MNIPLKMKIIYKHLFLSIKIIQIYQMMMIKLIEMVMIQIQILIKLEVKINDINQRFYLLQQNIQQKIIEKKIKPRMENGKIIRNIIILMNIQSQ